MRGARTRPIFVEFRRLLRVNLRARCSGALDKGDHRLDGHRAAGTLPAACGQHQAPDECAGNMAQLRDGSGGCVNELRPPEVRYDEARQRPSAGLSRHVHVQVPADHAVLFPPGVLPHVPGECGRILRREKEGASDGRFRAVAEPKLTMREARQELKQDREREAWRQPRHHALRRQPRRHDPLQGAKAPPTTPPARGETSSQTKCCRLAGSVRKPSSGILITRPTCPISYGPLGYHRDHLENVVGERAGHRIGTMCPSDQRDSGDDITSPSASGRRTNSEVLRHCLQENGWCADARLVEGGVAPGHGPKSEPTHPART